jgi:hypothetical protein
MEVVVYACKSQDIYEYVARNIMGNHQLSHAIAELAYVQTAMPSILESRIHERATKVFAISTKEQFQPLTLKKKSRTEIGNFLHVGSQCSERCEIDALGTDAVDRVVSVDVASDFVTEFFATLTNRKYHSSLEGPRKFDDLARNSASLTVVGLHGSISHADIDVLANVAMCKPTGLLVGRSYEMLSQVIAWQLFNNLYKGRKEQSLIVLSDMSMTDAYSGSESLQLIFDEEDSLPSFEDTRERFDFVSFGGHGGPVDMSISPSVILCGLRRNVVSPATEKLHTCQITGECSYDPLGVKKRISIENIDARVLFLRTCMGLGMGDQKFSSDLLMSIGALESGTLAYISAISQTTATNSTALILNSLLRSGIAAGHAVRVMACVDAGNSGEDGVYLLLGDPLYTLETEWLGPTIKNVVVEKVAETNSLSIEFEATNLSEVLLVELTSINSMEHGLTLETVTLENIEFANAVSGDSTMALASSMITEAFRLDGKFYLAICPLPSMRGFRFAATLRSVDTTRDSAIPFQGHHMMDVMLLAGALNLRSGQPQFDQASAAPGARALLDLCAGATQAMRSWIGAVRGQDMTRQRQVRETLRGNAAKLLCALQRKAVKSVDNWGLPANFSALLEDIYVPIKVEEQDVPCPSCYTSISDLITLAIPFFPENHRYCHSCRCCSFISVGSAKTAPPSIQAKKSAALAGTSVSLTLTYVNKERPHVAFAANLYFERRLPWNLLKSLDENGVARVVALGEVLHEEFNVEVPLDMKPGLYKIMLFYFVDLSFGVVTTLVNVLPRMHAVRAPVPASAEMALSGRGRVAFEMAAREGEVLSPTEN